jgi:NAD(P)-dependent dehydrogenase (short-subunit alcohol dehydrogenase family)
MNANYQSKRVWFITGASRGFGEKISLAALANGDAVVATARNPQTILEKFGKRPNLLAVKLDVTDESQVSSAVDESIKKFGRIDVLVNNAGYGLIGAVEEASAEEVRRMYETNVFGVLNVTRGILPHMRKQHTGHIINFSSLGGYRSVVGFGVYCSTKFAIEGLSEALHAELAPLGIHVTVVEPGYFRTDFLDSTSLVDSKKHIEDYSATAGKVRDKAKDLSHQQPGDPDKLAHAIVMLVEAKVPPMRLPLGSDTIQAIENKNAFVKDELERWRELAVSTDFTERY